MSEPTTQVTSEGTELLRLASADNFRDVAGGGYAGTDGRTLAAGRLYRSNELRLSGEDLDAVASLGLTTIIDLRSDSEIERHPDPEIPGATARHFDVIGIPMEQLADLRTRAEAVDLMDRTYTGFVETESCRVAFAGVFRTLAEDGPHLFHCTAGKDRTGWVAALLLHLAGVDDATIEADYLLTNPRSAASRERVEQEIVAHLGQQALEVFEPTLVADLEYLHAAYAAADRRYGGRVGYLRDGLGLDDATLAALRSHLLD